MIKRFLVLAVLLVVCIALASCGKSEQATESSDLTEPAKQFVAQLADGDFVTAVESFNAKMRQAMSADGLEQAWASLTAKLGAFEQQAGTRTAKEQGFDVVYVTCEFKRGKAGTKVVFDRKQRITGLWFVPPE